MKLNPTHLLIYTLLGIIAAMLFVMLEQWQRYRTELLVWRMTARECDKVVRCRHYNPKPHWGNDVGKCKHIAEYLLVSNETCVDSDFYCKNFEPSVKSG